MSTSKIATTLGAAALLLGLPTFALAGQDGPGKPENPGGVHQCEDGVDNDHDDRVDYAEDGSGDPDCGSPRDNSEGPEDEPEAPGGGGELPELPPGGGELPPELQALIDQVLAQLPAEEEPCEGEECEEPPAPPALPVDPAEVEALVQSVVDQLPSGGGEPPAPPALPVDPAEVEALVQSVVDQLPDPPA